MIIELDLEPADVGILLDALVDYRDRTRLEAAAEDRATEPSRVVVHLAESVATTTHRVIDQLARHADAIPAAARAEEVRHLRERHGFEPAGWQL